MKNKFGIIAAIFLLCIGLAGCKAQGITPYPQSGCAVSPACVQWGRYANKTAVFDSTGTLNIGGTCASCPQSLTTYSKTIMLTKAQILNLGSVGDTIIPAPTGSLTINVLAAYVTSPQGGGYDGDTIMVLYEPSGLADQGEGIIARVNNPFVGAGGTQPFFFSNSCAEYPSLYPVVGQCPPSQMVANKPLVVQMLNVGNPTGGTGVAYITVIYNLLNLVSGGGQ